MITANWKVSDGRKTARGLLWDLACLEFATEGKKDSSQPVPSDQPDLTETKRETSGCTFRQEPELHAIEPNDGQPHYQAR